MELELFDECVSNVKKLEELKGPSAQSKETIQKAQKLKVCIMLYRVSAIRDGIIRNVSLKPHEFD